MRQKFLSITSFGSWLTLQANSFFFYISFRHMYLISAALVLPFHCVMICYSVTCVGINVTLMDSFIPFFLAMGLFSTYFFLNTANLPKWYYQHFTNPFHNFCSLHSPLLFVLLLYIVDFLFCIFQQCLRPRL